MSLDGRRRTDTLLDLRKKSGPLRWMGCGELHPTRLPTVEESPEVVNAQDVLDKKTTQAANFRRSRPGQELPPKLETSLEKAKANAAKVREETETGLAALAKAKKIRGQRASEAALAYAKDGPRFELLYTELEELGKASLVSKFSHNNGENRERVKFLLGELVPLAESFRISADAIKAKHAM